MISNQKNVPDWLSPEYEQEFMSISRRTKAVIMGRTIYNFLAPDYLPLKEDGSLVTDPRHKFATGTTECSFYRPKPKGYHRQSDHI
jgi:dihydrofolate reductase